MALSKAQKAALDAKREEARLDEVRQESANNYLEFLKAKEAGEQRSYRQYRAHQRYIDRRDAKRNAQAEKERKDADEKAAKEKQIIDVSKKGQSLAKAANKLAKDSKSMLLERLGIGAKDLSYVKAAAAARKADNYEEAAGYNALESLRQEAISQLEEGTFVAEEFDQKLGAIKDKFDGVLPKEDIEDFKDSFKSARENAEAISKSLSANLPFLDQIDNLQQKAEQFSAIISSGPAMMLAALGLATKLLVDFVMQTKDIRQNLGATSKDAIALSADMSTASAAAKAFGGDSDKAGQAVQSLAQNMGRVPQLSMASAIEFGKIASLSGATAESVATIAELNALATGQSVDKSVADLASLEALAEQEGVLKSGVFEDVAQAAKDQALFFGKSAVEIGKAAVQMRKLGISASALNNVAESLLDLETSISSEFELQALFGKNINLNKAREAAFNRDSVGLATEIRRQLGGQFDLSKANAAQVKSLTEAFGLSQEELQKVIQGQDIFNSKAEEGNKSILMQLGTFVGIATAVGATIGAILGGLGIFTGGLSFAGFKAMAIGTAKGAAIGAGVGASALGAKKMFEDAHIGVDRKPVGSQAPGATFALGDAASINVSKETQTAINLHTNELKRVLREEVAGAIRDLTQTTNSKLEGVQSATETAGRNIVKAID